MRIGVVLSQSRTKGSAAVVRVSGVSFNYLQFLWKKLDLISRVAEQGNYPIALKLATELIPWLPESMKTEFMERAMQHQTALRYIRSNKLPQLYKIIDIQQRTSKRNWLLHAYSITALQNFIYDLTSRLDQMGYMENTKVETVGSVDEPTWAEKYRQEMNTPKGKSSKKKELAPTGEAI